MNVSRPSESKSAPCKVFSYVEFHNSRMKKRARSENGLSKISPEKNPYDGFPAMPSQNVSENRFADNPRRPTFHTLLAVGNIIEIGGRVSSRR